MVRFKNFQRVCIVVILSSIFSLVSPAYSAVILVNTTSDDAPQSGECRLRDAITAANIDFPVSGCTTGNGNDVILFQGFSNSTITLNSQLPKVTSTIEINGEQNNLSISGNNNSRIFFVQEGDLTLKSMTLEKGASSGGSAIIAGSSQLLLDSVILKENNTSDNGGAAYFNFSTVQINNSTISGNEAGSQGGGIYASQGSITINNSTISGNSAKLNGGGFHISYAITKINNSTISGNETEGNGGGAQLFINENVVTINNSTIFGNAAQRQGGGISGFAFADGGMTINNSIVSGNTASNGEAEIHTPSSNNDIVINSQNTLWGSRALTTQQAFSNHFIPSSNNGNIIATSDSENIPLNEIIIPSLANNGGDTRTHGLPVGSPAIDSGNNGTCLATDQRGEIRPAPNGVALICDMGAFEWTVIDEVEDETFFVIPTENGKAIISL